jgi:acetyl-CoA acetyltransferase
MTSISEQVEKATTSLGKKNARSKEINQAYQELVAQDVKNRDVRKQRTFMEPDKYRGGDIDAIKEKAAALVKADSKEGGTPLRTTVISEEWREASAWEWTDTARTQRRYRTTRSLSAQVAAKRSDGVHLITVAIARDKQADGLWGPLYGNLHQYSEPMLEENVNKTGSSKIAVKAK